MLALFCLVQIVAFPVGILVTGASGFYSFPFISSLCTLHIGSHGTLSLGGLLGLLSRGALAPQGNRSVPTPRGFARDAPHQ